MVLKPWEERHGTELGSSIAQLIALHSSSRFWIQHCESAWSGSRRCFARESMYVSVNVCRCAFFLFQNMEKKCLSSRLDRSRPCAAFEYLQSLGIGMQESKTSNLLSVSQCVFHYSVFNDIRSICFASKLKGFLRAETLRNQ